MKAIRFYTFTAILTMLFAGGLTLRSHAAAPDMKQPEHNLSHFVHFETGGTWFRNGDKITIDEIHGTSDVIAPGNLFEIKGKYVLASHDQARLTVDVTSSDTRHFPSMDTQTMVVDKGDGHFTIYLYMWTTGNPHLSFYPAKERGESFASIYFGTGDSVLKNASWLDAAH